ncbi:hypothetical protein DFR88_02350 [Metallosphaera sedula]|uniref:DUF4352 domain-containing protein n=2 Tax=Metallosphaera prunae TaxID=47304 RepID=A0A4D8S168_METPR|nr:hypothetical protein DFR88_02350 [Metallosphaera prunae]
MFSLSFYRSKMGRYIRSRRAISGAVTALILVIVSVALALAVAVFAFGLFGSFGGSGNGIQVVGTPVINVKTAGTDTVGANYNITVQLTVKNTESTLATIESISIAGLTNSSVNQQVAAGATHTYTLYILAKTLPTTLGVNNVGTSIPIQITFAAGALNPTLTVYGNLNTSV